MTKSDQKKWRDVIRYVWFAAMMAAAFTIATEKFEPPAAPFYARFGHWRTINFSKKYYGGQHYLDRLIQKHERLPRWPLMLNSRIA